MEVRASRLTPVSQSSHGQESNLSIGSLALQERKDLKGSWDVVSHEPRRGSRWGGNTAILTSDTALASSAGGSEVSHLGPGICGSCTLNLDAILFLKDQ